MSRSEKEEGRGERGEVTHNVYQIFVGLSGVGMQGMNGKVVQGVGLKPQVVSPSPSPSPSLFSLLSSLFSLLSSLFSLLSSLFSCFLSCLYSSSSPSLLATEEVLIVYIPDCRRTHNCWYSSKTR